MTDEKRHIFIVDDDPGLLDLMHYLIKKNFSDCEVTTFPGVQSVAAKLSDCVPDVIVTDILMPGMSGVEFMYKLRSDKKFSKIKVIAITGLDKNDPRVNAVRLIGFFKIVYKESAFTSTLIKTVETALSGKEFEVGGLAISGDDTDVYEGIEEVVEKTVIEKTEKRQAKIFNHESVLESMDGDFEMLRIAVKSFLSTSDMVIQQLEEGMAEGITATAARAAHTMAGAAGSIGGERLKNICSETETSILTKGCKESMFLLRGLKVEFTKMTDTIKKVL